MGGGQPDEVLDAVALVQAVRDGDDDGILAIVGNADREGVCLALARLVAEAADEQQASAGHLRAWAFQALNRP